MLLKSGANEAKDVQWEEFERLIQSGEVGPDAEVQSDILTGGVWARVGDLAMFNRLRGLPVKSVSSVQGQAQDGVSPAEERELNQSTETEAPSGAKAKSFWSSCLGLVGLGLTVLSTAVVRALLGSNAAGPFLQASLIILLTLGVAGGAGYGLAALYARMTKRPKLVVGDIVAWSNLGVWILMPALAALAAGATYRLGRTFVERRRRYYVLASIGVALTIAMMIVLRVVRS